MNVLLTTVCAPDDRKTLAAARALAAQGARVFVVGDELRGQAYWSRFVRGRFHLPHPEDDEAGHIEALLDAVIEAGVDVVLPTRVETTLPLAKHRARLDEHVKFAVPPESGLRLACDKRATLRLAEEAGVRIPKTVCPANLEELREACARLSFPIVVKPVSGEGALGLWFADSEEALIEGWNRPRPGDSREPAWGRRLVQEYVSGRVHDGCFLFRRGEPRAALTQKRILLYPAQGGIGVFNETTDDPELAAAGERLLRRLEWHGPAQVEFKRDDSSGEPVLMEINGRLWGTLDLSVQAGMNFPWLICRMAMDGDAPAQTGYRKGLRYRWPFPYGLLHAMESGRPLHAMRTFFGPARNTRSDLRWDDPLPALAEARYTLQRMRKRGSWRPMRSGMGAQRGPERVSAGS